MKEKLVAQYGPLWAKNTKNLRQLKASAGNSIGVYLLYCGWFPVYIGRVPHVLVLTVGILTFPQISTILSNPTPPPNPFPRPT